MVELPVENTILDGEIVCLDQDGRSQFRELMHRRRHDAAFYAFDLLWLNGEDVRGCPLMERKRRLRQLIRGQNRILHAEHIPAKGVDLFRAICDKDLEGIVCKHRLAPYSAKPQSWFKVLNPDYTEKRGRGEMFDKFRERRSSVPA
jgi:bifunctional non-homologous end joining protein LigD